MEIPTETPPELPPESTQTTPAEQPHDWKVGEKFVWVCRNVPKSKSKEVTDADQTATKNITTAGQKPASPPIQKDLSVIQKLKTGFQELKKAFFDMVDKVSEIFTTRISHKSPVETVDVEAVDNVDPCRSGSIMKMTFQEWVGSEENIKSWKDASNSVTSADDHPAQFERDFARQTTAISIYRFLPLLGSNSNEVQVKVKGGDMEAKVVTKKEGVQRFGGLITDSLSSSTLHKKGFDGQAIQRLRYQVESLLSQRGISPVPDSNREVEGPPHPGVKFTKEHAPAERTLANGHRVMASQLKVSDSEIDTSVKDSIVNTFGGSLHSEFTVEGDKIIVTGTRYIKHMDAGQEEDTTWGEPRVCGYDAQIATFTIDLNKMNSTDLLLSPDCVTITNEYLGMREEFSELMQKLISRNL